jgi:hypothetical protein
MIDRLNHDIQLRGALFLYKSGYKDFGEIRRMQRLRVLVVVDLSAPEVHVFDLSSTNEILLSARGYDTGPIHTFSKHLSASVAKMFWSSCCWLSTGKGGNRLEMHSALHYCTYDCSSSCKFLSHSTERL